MVRGGFGSAFVLEENAGNAHIHLMTRIVGAEGNIS
jgi:hypothetical protein